jgi:hypothetical protein
MAAVLVVAPSRAHARQFMATAASCADAPADQQAECRACVDTQTMLRTGIAKHWWPSQPAGDRCVTALRSMDLVRASSGGRGSSSSTPAAAPSAPTGRDDRPNATVYTRSRCDRLFSGAQAAECRVCTANPRGRYHQYEAPGARCRTSNNEVLAAGDAAPAAPAAAGAPAAGSDPRNDPREYSTVYTVSRCQRHIPGALQAECARCVDTPRGASVRRFHQFEPAGTRCRQGSNVVVQP